MPLVTNMQPPEVEAWVSMAEDKTLRLYIQTGRTRGNPGIAIKYKQALRNRVLELERDRK